MSWQVAVATYLIVASRVGELPFVHFTPEGFEDIDCRESDGSATFVQVKEAGAGAGRLTAVDVAEAIAHVAGAAGDGRIALVTDGELGSGLTFTGWTAVLSEQGGKPVDGVIGHLTTTHGLSEAGAKALVARTALVSLPWSLRPLTERMATDELAVHPTVASFAVGRLYEVLTSSSADQRSTLHSAPITHSIGDLDAILTRVQSAVDVSALDAAVADGVCAAADFVQASDLLPWQFYAGVDAAPGHVAAGLDVLRPTEMSQIIETAGAERYALLLGPSGSGKSMLLWRAARDAVLGARVVRVRRLADERDVGLLARHVDLLVPSKRAPVVVVADNLGRPGLDQWPDAVDRLRENAGVFLLGAVRAEDFSAHLVRGAARVIELRLDSDTAQQIAERIRQSGMQLSMGPSEAEERAEGLLMEFVALLTTGQRLEKVLAEQVETLRRPGRELHRTLVRLVTAAHTAGVSVPAAALAVVAPEGNPSETVGDALSDLRGEYVLALEGTEWRGLHELRSDVVTGLMHESPPPTLGQTYAEVVRMLPPSAAGWLLRRAAEQAAQMDPVVDSIGEALVRTDLTAADAAVFFEGAERADNALYAKACLPVLRANVRGSTTVEQLALLVYSIRNQGRVHEPTGFEHLDETMRTMSSIADQLPERTAPIASGIATRVANGRLVELLMNAPLVDAVRLAEATSGVVPLSRTEAQMIYQGFPDPVDPDAADLHARLLAALAEAAELNTLVEHSTTFGTVHARADLVSRVDPNTLAVTVDDATTTITATVLYSPYDSDAAATHIWDLPRAEARDAVNDMLMRVATRLADACPEASTIEVIAVTPSGKPWRPGGYDMGHKRIARPGFPQRAGVRQSVGFRVALRRLNAAGSWTGLIAEQGAIASELVDLLRQAPARLSPADNAKRRRVWQERAQALPARTRDLGSYSPARESHDPNVSSAQTDHADQDSNEVSKALQHLAQELPRLLGDGHLLGIASNLRTISAEIKKARIASDPKLSDLGRPLPGELTDYLDDLVSLLVICAATPAAARRIKGSDSRETIHSMVRCAIDGSIDDERALLQPLAEGLDGVVLQKVADPDPAITNLEGHAWLFTTPVRSWQETVLAMQNLTQIERSKIPSRIMVVAVEADTVLPAAIRLAHVEGQPDLPMTLEMMQPFTSQLNLEPAAGDTSSMVRRTLDELTAISWHLARARLRDPGWPTAPSYPAANLADLRADVETRLGMADGVISEVCDALAALIDQVQDEISGAASTTLAGEILDGLNSDSSDLDVTNMRHAVNTAVLGAALLSAQ